MKIIFERSLYQHWLVTPYTYFCRISCQGWADNDHLLTNPRAVCRYTLACSFSLCSPTSYYKGQFYHTPCCSHCCCLRARSYMAVVLKCQILCSKQVIVILFLCLAYGAAMLKQCSVFSVSWMHSFQLSMCDCN